MRGLAGAAGFPSDVQIRINSAAAAARPPGLAPLPSVIMFLCLRPSTAKLDQATTPATPAARHSLQNPGAHDVCGRTALHAAAGLAWPAMVALLLKRGCPPDVRDRKGATPLAAAAAEAARAADQDLQDVMQLLFRHGASIEAADAESFRPLAYAANWAGDIGQGQRGQESLVALKFLLDRGAAIDAVNVDGATALMIAVDEVRWCGVQRCKCRTTRPALVQCQLTCGLRRAQARLLFALARLLLLRPPASSLSAPLVLSLPPNTGLRGCDCTAAAARR